jgi:hypothetical protein
MVLLSPEEKELVEAHREMNRRPKQKKRALPKRPPPQNKEEAMKELVLATRDFKTDLKRMKKEREQEREDAWGFKWSWDRGVATPGKPSADNPQYDDDGNLIVAPEVVRTYKVPDLHTGLLWDVTEDKLRAALEVEIFELKVPKLRYLPVGIVGAEQYLGLHISKRWTSIYEIETGVFFGRDFDVDRNTWGLAGLIIKF